MPSPRNTGGSASALVMGMLFLAIAAIAAWLASGRELSHGVVAFGIPGFLIALGAIGLVLSRRR